MPELPEVETVRLGLLPALAGRRLVRLEARRPDLRFPLPERFAERLEGRTILSLERRAKYMIATFEGGDALVLHLGMTGRFTIETAVQRSAPGSYIYAAGGDPRHDHVVFHMAGDDSEGGVRVTYNDARRFGFMVLVAEADLDAHPLMAGLGPEPLGAAFDASHLARRAAGKKVNLKSLLMDQRIVAGLGNIYVSEALHRAHLAPERKASTLADKKDLPHERAERLVSAIRATLADAIAAGGSTLRDYRHADGSQGAFQESFFVYDREGEACRQPGCGGTIRRAVHTGRSTFYCPRCQR